MNMTIIATLALAVLATEASAQSSTSTFYNSGGKSIGRATTNGGATTFYDASGRTTARSFTNGNTTTTYLSRETTTGNTRTVYDSVGRWAVHDESLKRLELASPERGPSTDNITGMKITKLPPGESCDGWNVARTRPPRRSSRIIVTTPMQRPQ
jgi:hypothetical protein